MLPDGKRNRTLPQKEEYIEDTKRWARAMELFAIYNAEKMNSPDYQTKTYILDHVEQTFTIRIRSLTGVTPPQIQNLIEKSYEVMSIECVDTNAVGVECIP